MIAKMGFVDYFLIVSDFIGYAKVRGHSGSDPDAARQQARSCRTASLSPTLTRFTIRCTSSDFFESGSVSPCRISTWTSAMFVRPEVIDNVTRKHGKRTVAHHVRHDGCRGAIRDVGRALNIPYNDVDAVAKQVPNELHITIDKALTINAELKKDVRRAAAGQSSLLIRRVRSRACRATHRRMRGRRVITWGPGYVDTYVPLSRNGDQMVTKYDGDDRGTGLPSRWTSRPAQPDRYRGRGKLIRCHTPDFPSRTWI